MFLLHGAKTIPSCFVGHVSKLRPAYGYPSECSREKVELAPEVYIFCVRANAKEKRYDLYHLARSAESKRLRDLTWSSVSPRCILLTSSARYATYTNIVRWKPAGFHPRYGSRLPNNSTNFQRRNETSILPA